MCIITLISSDVIHTCVLVCMYMHVHSYTNMVFIVVCVICCRHTVFVSQLLVTITSHAWMLSVSLLIGHATMTWSHILVVVSQSVSLLIDHATMTWSHILVVVSQSVY